MRIAPPPQSPLTPQSSCVIATIDGFNSTWCVYEVWLANASGADELFYIGVTKLNEVFHFNEARRNTHWLKHVTDQSIVTIRILWSGDRTACYNQRGLLVSAHRPAANVKGYDNIGVVAPVICNETGQQWPSQSDCSKALGIPQSQLSAHLRGVPGHRTVKGLTFRRSF